MPANNDTLPPPYAPRRRPVILSSASGTEECVPMWIGHMDLATAIIRAFDGGLRDGQSLSPGLSRPLLGGEHIELQYLRGLSIGMQDWKRQHPVPYELFRNLETDEVNGEGRTRLRQHLTVALAQPRPPPVLSLRNLYPQVWAPPAILPYPRYRAPRPPLHKTTRAELPADLPAESHTIAMPYLPLPVNVNVYTVATLWSNQLDEFLLMEDFGCWITPKSANMAPISSTRVAPAARRAIASLLQDGPIPDVHLPRSAAANMFGTVFASSDKEQILTLIKARAIVAPEICLLVLPNRPRDSDFVGTFESASYTREDSEQVRTSVKNTLNSSAAAVRHCVDAGLIPDLLFASVALEYVLSRGRNLWNVSLLVPRRPGLKMESWRRIVETLQPADGTWTDGPHAPALQGLGTGVPKLTERHLPGDDPDPLSLEWAGSRPSLPPIMTEKVKQEAEAQRERSLTDTSAGAGFSETRTRMGGVDDAGDTVPSPIQGQQARTRATALDLPPYVPTTSIEASGNTLSKRKRAEMSDDESPAITAEGTRAKKSRKAGSEPTSGDTADADAPATQTMPDTTTAARGRKRLRDESPSSQNRAASSERHDDKRARTGGHDDEPRTGTSNLAPVDDASTQAQGQGGQGQPSPRDLRDTTLQQLDEATGTPAVQVGDEPQRDTQIRPIINMKDLDPFEILSECDDGSPTSDDEVEEPAPPRRAAARPFLARPVPVTAGQRRPVHGKQMRERAHIHIGTLNMNGRGASRVSFSGSKWPEVNATIREHRLAVLVLQETHLNDSHLADIKRLYPRLHVRNSAHAAATSNAGIAIVLNKDHIADAENCESWEVIPGRGLVLRLEWKDQVLFILGVYGYNDDSPYAMAGEHGTLEKIYISKAWLDDSRDWKTEMAMSSTDHYLVSVELTNKLCPEIGRGRRAIPNSVIKDEAFEEDIHPHVIDLARNVEHARLNRSRDNNPQTVLDAFKKDMGRLALKRAKIMGSQAKRAVTEMNRERLATQNDASLSDEDQRSRVQTLELHIAEQQIKMMRQKSDMSETRARIDGDAVTSHFFAQGKVYQPKETIKSLQVPGSTPAQWKTHSPEMAKVARDFYEHLQTVDLDQDGPERDDAIEEALNHVNRHMSEDQNAFMAEALTYELVELSLKESANNSAPGTDGLLYEFWKMLQRRFQTARGSDKEWADIVHVLQGVPDDVQKEITGMVQDFLWPRGRKTAKISAAHLHRDINDGGKRLPNLGAIEEARTAAPAGSKSRKT
ncbi:hypothetical protein AURDEDRAFT_129016 [Auricularia subglabra TFB-10046 SS5]|nr:hypothetical protein AURDEDRAFT_129016 [Auricularia subglabra TFB-10046 SS5]